ncbi:hypothetical protein IHE45_10G027200 [Dioscorea alata]|uniref:Uncharacterized protein n=1 Tax=Dioscorea alata TaxID=55571 RepID=A0ACB7V9Z7_DIOAL|nr:hypothetical protein IHE45_10G027200 [Dioscorea alata]
MEFGDNTNNNDEIWEWAEEECFLGGNPEIDVSQYLWNDASQNEDSFVCMLGERTPTKDLTGFDHDMMSGEDNSCRNYQVSRDSSQHKRRRLQFSQDFYGYHSANEQNNGPFFKYQVREGSMVEDGLPDQKQLCTSGFSPDDICAYNDEVFNKPTEVLPENCLNESEMPDNQNEMNYHMESYKQTNISELCNIPPDTGNEVVHKTHTLNPCRIFKGQKSYIETPTKLTTSVAYPFALIKPCGVQGDVTLKDINQWIHAPLPSKSMNKIDEEDPSISYPTSAFSGKPVVVQTKLRTEGGKGSITIMRTKG